MGKVKQSQRTKGNTKPSDSRRAMMLTSNTLPVDGLMNFIGFEVFKTGDQLRGDDGGDLGENNFDQEFKLLMKQMYKKDPNTKIKALQKFAASVDDKEADVLKAILPSYTRIFNRLAIDNDFRVRGAVFLAHEKLVTKLGRNIAPHLKKIIAIWIIAIHDTYAVSASVAKSSFNAAFSPIKQKEVLNFCKDEIINYCKGILIIQTVETIEDASLSSQEEREIKYNRLASCSLQSLSLLLKSLDNPKTIEQSISELLQSDRFWKHGRQNDVSIRANWYRLKSSICEYLPEIAKNYGAKFTTTTLTHIAEKDPLLSAAIWENVLWILVTVDSCWSYIAMPKAFLPHLRKLLREGGYGNAASIFPNLLPMLSKFPFDTLDDSVEFVNEFLDSIEISLMNEYPLKEHYAMVKSYFECVQYLLSQNRLSGEKLCERILNSVKKMLISWTDVYSHYFHELTIFTAELKNLSLHQLILHEINSLVLNLIDSSNSDVKNLALVAKILSSLLRDAKSQRVCFLDQKDSTCDDLLTNSKMALIWMPLVQSSWKKILDQCADKNSPDSWYICLRVVQELYIALSKIEESIFPAENCINLLCDLLKLLQSSPQKAKDSSKRLLVNIILVCCEYTENFQILQSLSSNIFTAPALASIIQERYSRSTSVKELFSSPEINHVLLNFTSLSIDMCLSKKPSQSDLIILQQFLAFSFKIADIHYPSIDNLCEKLVQTFETNNSIDSLVPIISIVGDLFQNYKDLYLHEHFVQILKRLYSLSFNANIMPSTRKYLVDKWTHFPAIFNESNLEKCDQDPRSLFKELIKMSSEFIFSPQLTIKNYEYYRENIKALLYCIFVELDSHIFGQDKFADLSSELLFDLLNVPDKWFVKVNNLSPQVFLSYTMLGESLPLNHQKLTPHLVSDDTSLNLSILMIVEIVDLDYLPQATAVLEKVLPYSLFCSELVKPIPGDFSSSFKTTVSVALTCFNDEHLKDKNRAFYQKILDFILNKQTKALPLLIATRQLLKDLKEKPSVKFEEDIYTDVSILTFQFVRDCVNPTERIEIYQDAINKFVCFNDSDLLANFPVISIINSILRSNIELTYSEFIKPVLQKILLIKEDYEKLLLFESDLNGKTDQELIFVTEIVNIFQSIITKYHFELEPSFKDFIILSTTAWMITVGNSGRKSEPLPIVMITSARILDLFLCISKKIETEGEKFTSLREWTDFHLIRVARSIIPLFLKMNELSFYGHQLTLVHFLGKCVASLPMLDISDLCDALKNFKLTEKTTQPENAIFYPIPFEFEALLMKLNNLLVSKYPAFYLNIHVLIQKLIPFAISSSTIVEDESEEEEKLIAPSKPFLVTLQETDTIVYAMLSEYFLGETCCLIEVGTDSFLYTIAYLLNWSEILNLFSHLTAENRSLLARYLTESDYFSRLMDNLFKLMPLNPESHEKKLEEFIRKSLDRNFLDDLSVNHHVQAIACHVYFQVIRKMPACLRLWYGNLSKKIADQVNIFTINYMSDMVCNEEIRAIHNTDMSKFKDMTVRARTSAREVTAVYSIEHMSIELTIKLAENHPLSPPIINVGNRVGVGVTQWRTWLLQLTSFLTHQNGTILDGIILWNKNMCKKFDGLEECMICFYILHGSTCQTPKLCCKNCKKKFHPACLYKWFQSSNQSTCPLCRYLF